MISNNSNPLAEVNNRYYEFLVNSLLKSRTIQPEVALGFIEQIAMFACEHHPGRFADGAIENRAWEIGRELERHCEDLAPLDVEPEVSPTATDPRRRVLHVATAVTSIGGHTRTIQNWVANDPGSRHSLVLLQQTEPRIPAWLTDPIRANGGKIFNLPMQASRLLKARWLREIARSQADLVILHHYGFDVVPIVAFADDRSPPVTVLNHADHHFWLGSSVTDLVINLRSIGTRLSETRRHVRANSLLPIPLSIPPAGSSREVARKRLEIPPDQVVMLSVGRAMKYQPSLTHDFFAATSRLLDHHRRAHLYLVGVSEEDASRFGQGRIHPRLHPIGPMQNPTDYRSAADLYLEGFPFGSQTALLEAALAGLPIVPAFAPPLELVVASVDAISDLIENPTNEQAWFDQASRLIHDDTLGRSLGSALQKRVLAEHTGLGWVRCVNEVYQAACGLEHKPLPIPCTDCVLSETDVALSLWQASLRGEMAPVDSLNEGVRESLFCIAYAARQWGDYRASFNVLLRCFRRWGGNSRYFWSLAKLMPHWAARSYLQLKA